MTNQVKKQVKFVEKYLNGLNEKMDKLIESGKDKTPEYKKLLKRHKDTVWEIKYTQKYGF